MSGLAVTAICSGSDFSALVCSLQGRVCSGGGSFSCSFFSSTDLAATFDWGAMMSTYCCIAYIIKIAGFVNNS
jgi:hypothetical protein